MSRSRRPSAPGAEPTEGAAGLPRIETTADGSLTLRDVRSDQTYHSGHGAVAESRHVFLWAGGVAARLAAGRPTRVLEVGLGTGLNLLLTADAAVAAGAELHYRALEARLPPAAVLRALGHARHLDRPEIADAWIALRERLEADPERLDPHHDGGPGPAPEPGDAPAPGAPRLWRPEAGALAPGVRLEVALGDATRAPTIEEPGWAHAVYHDAFSPDAAPGLWDEPFLARLAAALAPGGALVSYTVKGVVRRRLAALGLRVEKLPGPPGGKREMLRAMRPG